MCPRSMSPSAFASGMLTTTLVDRAARSAIRLFMLHLELDLHFVLQMHGKVIIIDYTSDRSSSALGSLSDRSSFPGYRIASLCDNYTVIQTIFTIRQTSSASFGIRLFQDERELQEARRYGSVSLPRFLVHASYGSGNARLLCF